MSIGSIDLTKIIEATLSKEGNLNKRKPPRKPNMQYVYVERVKRAKKEDQDEIGLEL